MSSEKTQSEAAERAEKLWKTLQMKSLELSSADMALAEAKRERTTAEQQAEALEKTCQLLRSECNSAEVLRGKQQDEHRRQLESLESQAHALELQRRRLATKAPSFWVFTCSSWCIRFLLGCFTWWTLSRLAVPCLFQGDEEPLDLKLEAPLELPSDQSTSKSSPWRSPQVTALRRLGAGATSPVAPKALAQRAKVRLSTLEVVSFSVPR